MNEKTLGSPALSPGTTNIGHWSASNLLTTDAKKKQSDILPIELPTQTLRPLSTLNVDFGLLPDGQASIGQRVTGSNLQSSVHYVSTLFTELSNEAGISINLNQNRTYSFD